jgi:hypothetical protein
MRRNDEDDPFSRYGPPNTEFTRFWGKFVALCMVGPLLAVMVYLVPPVFHPLGDNWAALVIFCGPVLFLCIQVGCGWVTGRSVGLRWWRLLFYIAGSTAMSLVCGFVMAGFLVSLGFKL